MTAARTLTAASTALLLTLLGAGPAFAADEEDQFCTGMSAPENLTPGNTAPAPVDDTVGALAGGTRTINVLRNDTDPEDDDLYVVSVTQPVKGEVCVDGDGKVEYFGVSDEDGYTDTFSYGVTDGDLYRTATVTVNVQGVKPMRARLVKRLKFGENGHKARVWFTNLNNRNMVLLAGSPKKKRPLLTRTISPNMTVKVRTNYKRLVWFAIVRDLDGLPIFVNLGTLNTRTAKQNIISPDSLFFRTHPRVQTLKRDWARPFS